MELDRCRAERMKRDSKNAFDMVRSFNIKNKLLDKII